MFRSLLSYSLDSLDLPRYSESAVPLDVINSISPSLLALILASGWVMYPHIHFYFFLLLFELIFLAIAVDLVLISNLLNMVFDSTFFALTVITFAALESVVGLSFLLFYSRTGNLIQMSKLNS